jgi:large subunit ribosomal protein L14
MIQKGTYLNVVDNSGAKKACCIQVYGGYRRRYAKSGDVILLSVKSLRKRNKEQSKVKKGNKVKGLVVRTKIFKPTYSNEIISSFENSVVLISGDNKLIGNRIFSPIDKKFRYTKYLKILSICSGVLN